MFFIFLIVYGLAFFKKKNKIIENLVDDKDINYVCTVYMCVCIYIYIYTERENVNIMKINIYIIYICICICINKYTICIYIYTICIYRILI